MGLRHDFDRLGVGGDAVAGGAEGGVADVPSIAMNAPGQRILTQ